MSDPKTLYRPRAIPVPLRIPLTPPSGWEGEVGQCPPHGEQARAARLTHRHPAGWRCCRPLPTCPARRPMTPFSCRLLSMGPTTSTWIPLTESPVQDVGSDSTQTSCPRDAAAQLLGLRRPHGAAVSFLYTKRPVHDLEHDTTRRRIKMTTPRVQ